MLAQNTDEWEEWRRQRIGASDLPVIMGDSPWKTPFGLWEEKLGLSKSIGNFATQRGHDLEPKARNSFELEMGAEFHPMLAVHQNYDWCGASLDGFNEELSAILEIKCPGKEDHATAMSGKIPDKYKAQINWQLFVTGAKLCYYYSFDGETGAVVIAYPDLKYCQELFKEAAAFWALVKARTPPPLTDRDQVEITDAVAMSLAGIYADVDDKIKKLEKQKFELKVELERICTHARTRIGRLSLTKVVKAGSIDYSAIPEIKGIDTEKYRKPDTSYVTIKVQK